MESLSEETWDAVIAGTSIPQALLALALSRSGKKILHVDRHDYYGGEDAGLSLQEAVDWAHESAQAASQVYSEASVSVDDGQDAPASTGRLAASRSYTLSLNPQIIYAQSTFLPTLVSSRIHSQLEFLAVGSWWIHRDKKLHRIPGTREDVFNDETLSMKDKRGLMKFLRFALQEEEDTSAVAVDPALSFTDVLSNTFKLRDSLQAPLLALALSPAPATSIPFSVALSRIRRHMRSMGYFGPGFGAVVAKYGGNSEMAQVACRAGAVGGAVYLLGHHLTTVQLPPWTVAGESTDESTLFKCTLSDGTPIKSKVVVGSLDDLPPDVPRPSPAATSVNVWRSINIIADPLRSLFPQTADNGPVPAVAIALVDDPVSDDSATGPIYLQVHSEDTGECPNGQCIIYASLMSESASAQRHLKAAVDEFVESCGAIKSILWTLSYRASTSGSQGAFGVDDLGSNLFCFGRRAHDLSFSDDILVSVKDVWSHVLGSDAADQHFLRFEERETEADD